jgi:hypothetical protein
MRPSASRVDAATALIFLSLLASSPWSILVSTQPPPDPIIIDIKEPESDEIRGLADILIGALGLTGLLVLASILAAVLFAGVLFWFRSRADAD